MNFALENLLTEPAFGGDPDTPIVIHRRPCFVAAVGMLLGLVIFSACGMRYAYYALAVVALLLCAALFFKKRCLVWILIWAVMSLSLICIRYPTEISLKSATVEGTVCGEPETEENASVFTLKNVTVNGEKIKGKLRVTVYALYGFSHGQRIHAEVTFRSADAENRYKLSRRIAAEGTAKANTVKVTGKDHTLYGYLIRVRGSIAERIGKLFPDYTVLARGMLLGSAQSGADADDAYIQSFRDIGISHLLAVSGLHVGILASAVIFLMRPIKKFLPQYLLLAAFLLFYAAITAFSPSVIRAAVMLMVSFPAARLRRRLDMLSSLSLAFILIILIDPFTFYGTGFRLSFLAVYGIVTLVPALRKGFSVLRKGVRDSLATSLAVLISTLPAIAEAYGSVSVAAIVANLFILPLVPFFFVPAFLVTLLSYIRYPLAAVCAVFPRVILKVIVWIVSLGGAVDISVTAPNGYAYLFCLAAMFFVSPMCVCSKRVKTALTAGFTAIGAVLWIIL